jgi:hypothetical protein
MTSGGVRFKWPNFDDIQRIPREDGGVDIVLDGEIIDTIEPIKQRSTPEEMKAHLREIDELATIFTENWADPEISAVAAVREQRRNVTPDEWVAPDERFSS